jgi:Cys-rich repeat protein
MDNLTKGVGVIAALGGAFILYRIKNPPAECQTDADCPDGEFCRWFGIAGEPLSSCLPY